MTLPRVLVALLMVGSVQASRAATPSVSVRVAVASQDDATVSEIDPGTHRVVARVVVGRGPAGLAASVGGNEIFVTHPDGAMIDVVSARTGAVLRRLAYEGEPFGIATAPGVVFVSDWSNHVVTRLDATTGVPTGELPVGASPSSLVSDLAHHRLYVANRETDDVSVIDTLKMRVIATIAAGASPFALALSPDGSRLFVTNVRSNDLTVIDTARLRRVVTVAAGAMPYGVAVTPDGVSILVTNQHGNTLRIIDAQTLAVAAIIPVGRYPEGVIVACGQAYVANWFSGDVSVVNLAQRREVVRIKVGDGPRNFTLLTERSGGP